MNKLLVALLTASALAGCATTATVPLAGAANYAAVPREEVLILRGSGTGFSYEEIGLTTKKGNNPKMDEIYDGLRAEAAKRGGHAVINVRIKTELVQVPVAHSSCSPQGGCVTFTTMSQQLAYVASGTLVRRKTR